MSQTQLRRILWGVLFLTPPLLFLIFLNQFQGLMTIDTPIPAVLAILVLPWVFGLIGVILILLGLFNPSKGLPTSTTQVTPPTPSAQIKDGLAMIAAAATPFLLILIGVFFFTSGGNLTGLAIAFVFFIPVSLVFAIVGLYKIISGLVRGSR